MFSIRVQRVNWGVGCEQAYHVLTTRWAVYTGQWPCCQNTYVMRLFQYCTPMPQLVMSGFLIHSALKCVWVWCDEMALEWNVCNVPQCTVALPSVMKSHAMFVMLSYVDNTLLHQNVVEFHTMHMGANRYCDIPVAYVIHPLYLHLLRCLCDSNLRMKCGRSAPVRTVPDVCVTYSKSLASRESVECRQGLLKAKSVKIAYCSIVWDK